MFSATWIGVGAYQTMHSYHFYLQLLGMRAEGKELHVEGLVKNFSPYDLSTKSQTESSK